MSFSPENMYFGGEYGQSGAAGAVGLNHVESFINTAMGELPALRPSLISGFFEDTVTLGLNQGKEVREIVYLPVVDDRNFGKGGTGNTFDQTTGKFLDDGGELGLGYGKKSVEETFTYYVEIF